MRFPISLGFASFREELPRFRNETTALTHELRDVPEDTKFSLAKVACRQIAAAGGPESQRGFGVLLSHFPDRSSEIQLDQLESLMEADTSSVQLEIVRGIVQEHREGKMVLCPADLRSVFSQTWRKAEELKQAGQVSSVAWFEALVPIASTPEVQSALFRVLVDCHLMARNPDSTLDVHCESAVPSHTRFYARCAEVCKESRRR